MNSENSPASRDYHWLLWIVAALVFAVDQWTKARIIEWLAIGETWRPFADTPLLELFAFTHIKNMGAAFGMFESGGWFFSVVAIAVSIFITFYSPRIPRERWGVFLALGLVMAGALGNLVDRIRLGWVTDFVHIGSFAIFNVADASVFTGVVIMFLLMWRDDEAKKRAEKQSAATPQEPQLLSARSDAADFADNNAASYPTPSES